MKAYGGADVQIDIFLDIGISWRCGQLHALAALPPGKESTVPIG
jgi:hypothetical protein